MAKVEAVGVIYNTKAEDIMPTVNSLKDQVDCFYLVDNSDNGQNLSVFFKDDPKVRYISLGDNMGIARAQNEGIKRILEDKADYILLSDQDTLYPADYVQSMLGEFKKSQFTNIAAMGPDFIDLKKGGVKQGFVRFYGLRSKKIYPQNGQVEVSQIIASGKMIDATKIQDVGLMDESLFIDWVDLEWCWRARAKGYRIIGTADVNIKHNLGDYDVKVGRTSYPVRGYIRHYYIMRNAVYLRRRSPYINFGMRVNLYFKQFKYLAGFVILGKNKSKQLKYSLKAIHDGRNDVLGKIKL